MTEQAIDVTHPPQALLKAINPALRLALKTSLSSALKRFTVASFTGRATHMRHAPITPWA